MAKSAPQLDVLVLGQHPCAYLAADMLMSHGVSVAHATIPGEHARDRLVILNAQLFALHKPLEKVRKKLDLTAVWGTLFLSDEPGMRGEWRSSKSAAAWVGCFSDIRKSFAQLARDSGVKLMAPKLLEIRRIDEKGFEIAVDSHTLRPRAMLLSGEVSGENAKVLGLPEAFTADVMRRYAFLRLRGPASRWMNEQADPRPLLPMSLDVGGKLTWAWLLSDGDEVQLAIEQPLSEPAHPSSESIMQRWAQVLRAHGILKTDAILPFDQIEWMDIPAAGALSREIIANRTLLFGPAGGFYTACMEDLYPNCWSAVFAVDAVRAALKETHLQDALQPYRQVWGTTLGEYLRGPQQNLRFLLPLVYRNPVMTSRLGESILQGKSVVR